MEESYIRQLFVSRNIAVDESRRHLFADFVTDLSNKEIVNLLLENEIKLMEKWALKTRIADIEMQQVILSNATVGKPYSFTLDAEKLKWTDLAVMELAGAEACGLAYDPANLTLSGTPTISGDIRLLLKYRMKTEPETIALHEKKVRLVVNPDPKSLWKNLPSDNTAPGWKADESSFSLSIGTKQVLAASKRGRSHANVGGFREDDFLVKHWPENGWTLLAVSDGAGSAQFSREGSRLACAGTAAYFDNCITSEWCATADNLIAAYQSAPNGPALRELNEFIYTNLGQAALHTHKKIEEAAKQQSAQIKDFHATLIFVLLKQYDTGYAFMSFSVGDCPIGLMDIAKEEVILLNRLDVGEYGGGTRFITMHEIFQSEQFAGRFSFKMVPDFSYLMLMTDGIYDPKFEVEANLAKVSAWQQLLADLNGENEGKIKVSLEKPASDNATAELSAWLDFWSHGNHDDRTLMMVY